MAETRRAARGSVQSRAAAALSKRTIRPLTAVMPIERAWGLWLARQLLARLMDACGPSLSGTDVEHVDTTLSDGRRLVGNGLSRRAFAGATPPSTTSTAADTRCAHRAPTDG